MEKKGDETTKVSLSSCYMTDTGIHLLQLNTESVKVSIHALKLCHDSLQGHITKRGRRRRSGRTIRSCKIGSHHMWPLRSKLSLAPLNSIGVDGTHNEEERKGIRNLDRKVLKDTHDSRRKYELIMCSHILIDIDDRSDEVKKEVYGKVL